MIKLTAIGAAGFFLIAMGLKAKRFDRAGETAGVIFHILLLPIVAILLAPEWVKAAGYAWLAIDVIVGVAAINGLPETTAWPLRLGGHVLAGIWIFFSSLNVTPLWFSEVGIVLALNLGGYSIAAPWASKRFLLPSGILMVGWLLAIGFTH